MGKAFGDPNSKFGGGLTGTTKQGRLDVLNATSDLPESLDFFGGPTFAGQSGVSGQGRDALLDTAQNFLPGQLQIGQDFLQSMLDPALNQNLKNMIGFSTDEILKSLGQANNQTGLQATAAGQFGGSRQGVVDANKLGTAQDAIGDNARQMLQNFENQRIAAFTNNFDRVTNLGSAQGNLLTQIGLGDEFRSQQQIDEDMARFNFDQMSPLNMLAFKAGLFNQPLPPKNGGGGPGTGEQILGSLVGLGGSYLEGGGLG